MSKRRSLQLSLVRLRVMVALGHRRIVGDHEDGLLELLVELLSRS
jgi:hypothetical protein